MPKSSPIKWDDAMLTGVDEIDQQHRFLVDTLIEADAKLVAASGDKLFEQITRDLLAYAIYHFDTEERLMRQFDYGGAEAEAAKSHLAQHRRFSEQVVAMRAAARAGDEGARDALLTFLKNWLTGHILNTDQQLGRFLRSRM